MCYPVLLYLTCFIVQWFFIFCHFVHFIWSNCLFSLENKKFDWIANFEILIKRPAYPNRARRELICEPVCCRDLIARSHFLACETPKRPLSPQAVRGTAENELQSEYWRRTCGDNRSASQKCRHLPDCATIIIYSRSPICLSIYHSQWLICLVIIPAVSHCSSASLIVLI